jgi:hypothetical protein
MKRWKWTSIMAVGLLLAVFAFDVGTSFAVMRHYVAQVYRVDYNKQAFGSPLAASQAALTGITYKVMAIGTTTAETVYSGGGPGNLSSKTNPVTTTVFATDGRIDFWCDPTDATNDLYVDLLVVDSAGGFTSYIQNFRPSDRSVVLDVSLDKPHKGQIWFNPTTTDETSTGITFKQGTYIRDVFVQVITAAAAATIDVGLISSGTTGDADGFRKGVLLTTTGYVKDTGVVTNGTTIDYTAATTYGALLYTAITGSDAVASGGGRSYIGHVIRGTQTGVLTYTSYSTAGKGMIHYAFEVNTP